MLYSESKRTKILTLEHGMLVHQIGFPYALSVSRLRGTLRKNVLIVKKSCGLERGKYYLL